MTKQVRRKIDWSNGDARRAYKREWNRKHRVEKLEWMRAYRRGDMPYYVLGIFVNSPAWVAARKKVLG